MQTKLKGLRGKGNKKAVLEQILAQQEAIKKEQKKLCNLLADETGLNVHAERRSGVQNVCEATLLLVLRLRGGMYTETSGRDGLNEIEESFEERCQKRRE